VGANPLPGPLASSSGGSGFFVEGIEMLVYKCKCGNLVITGSMPPRQCDRCSDCGYRPAILKDVVKPAPHYFEADLPADVVEALQDAGVAGLRALLKHQRCKTCGQTRMRLSDLGELDPVKIEINGQMFEVASHELTYENIVELGQCPGASVTFSIGHYNGALGPGRSVLVDPRLRITAIRTDCA